MADQFPAIVVLAPLIGALVCGLAGTRDHRICIPVVFASLGLSLAAAIGALVQAATNGPIRYFLGGWEEPIGIGIELQVDTINGLILVAIAIVFLLTGIFSIRRAGADNTEKTPQFYILFLLLSVGLFGMSITADAFNLFVLIEVSSLTSYALIAMGSSSRGSVAAFNYIIMGTIGASFYLLGIGYLYMQTGTLNMEAIRETIAAENLGETQSIRVAFILIMVGVWTKMAFFPLYGWLPNAYSYCPSTTSCVLAPLVTKVSVYVMIRVMLGIFGPEWVFGGPQGGDLVVWLAVIAIVAGSVLALAQVELKKMLCYLIVAEVGYMVGGAWLANHWGVVGAIFHILSDAFMTLCLFVGASILVKHCGAFRIDKLGGMFRKMPWVMAGFTVGGLAMIGVPPTCGFFSKWYLIRGGIESGHWNYVVALLVSSLINAVLFFRIFEIAYFGKNPPEGHGHDHESGEEGSIGDSTGLAPGKPGPFTQTALLLSAAIVILLGIFNGEVVELIQQSIRDLPVVGLK